MGKKETNKPEQFTVDYSGTAVLSPSPREEKSFWNRIDWALIISILSFLLSLVSLYLVEAQNKYTNLFLPFTYSAVRKEPATLHYTIGDGLVLPAYETRFQVETGSCDAFYIIGYNGDSTQTTAIGAALRTKDSPGYHFLSSGPVPYTSFPETCRVLYDYFFVYTVSSSGEKSLALFYYRIDLDRQSVDGPIRMDPIELLNGQLRESDPLFNDMCRHYEQLLENVNSLPGIGSAASLN